MTKNVGRCSELAEVILCVQVFEKLHTRHSSIVQYCKFKDSLLNNIYWHAILVFCTLWLSFCKLCKWRLGESPQSREKVAWPLFGKAGQNWKCCLRRLYLVLLLKRTVDKVFTVAGKCQQLFFSCDQIL